MTLTVDANRQILYAALLQHAPEADSLRDRALDRLILLALLGSSSGSPMTVGAIRNAIRVAPQSAGLRQEVITGTLKRLRGRNAVEYTLSNNRPAYYLTELGRRHIDEATDSAVQLFRPVLASLLRDTDHLCDARDATTVFRTFISECFARFGQQIARDITGELTKDQLVKAADIDGAFRAATKSITLSDDAKESLRARCIRFLRSAERHDTALKFRLTQGYFVAQLFGVSSLSFNPLADDTFRQAIFYLDTNVLVDLLLAHDVRRSSAELVRVCASLDVEIRVTRGTIDEAAALAAARYRQIRPLVDSLPTSFMEKSDSAFLEAFLSASKRESTLTLNGFFERFGMIPSILRELGVTLYEKTTDETIGDRNIAREFEIIQKAARDAHGESKTATVCRHDVAHYLLIHRERSRGHKAWFLTRDRTLGRAAVELNPGKVPFCFSLTGFLQSVSPFIETPEAQSSLVDLFGTVLTGETGDLSGQALFDLEELRIVSALYTDLLATSPEQLLEAVDYVKRNVLRGRPFREQNQPEIALEIRKRLGSSKEDQLRALQNEITRQEALVAEREAEQRLAENELRKRDEEIDRLESAAEKSFQREKAKEQATRRLRRVVAVLGAILTMCLWTLDSAIVTTVTGLSETASGWGAVWQSVVRALGAVALVSCLLPLVRQRGGLFQGSILTGVVGIGILGSDLIPAPAIREMAFYLAVAGPIAFLLLSMRGSSGPNRQGET